MGKRLIDGKFKLLYFMLGSFVVIYYSLALESTLAIILNALFLSTLVGLVYFLILILEKREIACKESRQYKEKLDLKESEMKALFDNNNSYLWTINLEEKTFTPSIGIEEIFGYSKEEFRTNYELWLERVIPEDLHLAQEYYESLKEGKPSNKSFRFKNVRNEVRWLDAWGIPIITNGKVTHLTGVAYDITERKQLEKELQYNATHDYLTGLPNRRMLNRFAKKEIVNNQNSSKKFAILFLDLDNFKNVNDHYGHSKGDLILIQAAQRLKGLIDEESIISRQGGDEFIIITPYHTYDKLMALVEQIIEAFELPFQLDGNQHLTASVGISIYPKDGDTVDSLIGQADRAMYQAKSRGKSNYQFADPVSHEAERRKQKVEHDLFKALKNKELYILYQPKIILETGEVYGVEALLRWYHPKLGTVSPDEFIPIAEAKGLIHDIGLWVLNEVISQNKKWETMGIDLTCSVNVSNIQFENPLFIDRVKHVLDNHSFDPEKLSMEITETYVQSAHSIESIGILHKMGIDISIDDFGTGYSSLSVLSVLPVKEIKIDQTFVNALTVKEVNEQIVNTIIRLGQVFDSRVVAEGIETHEQAMLLKEMGCFYGQGYLYSKPVSPDEIEKLFHEK